MLRSFHLALLLWSFLGVASSFVCADEWPSYRHDQRRSGVSSEQLATGQLTQAWQWQSPLPPVSAWPDAARWDAYAQLEGMRSMRDYDSAFQPVISQGKLLLGSNADDSLHCFDLVSGAAQWTFTSGGPIRVAPVLADGKAYFGSDDGCVYAVKIEDGSLLWKRQLVEEECFINDGRLCSFAPVRTGVLLDQSTSTLVAGAGIFPWRPSALCALHIADGEIAWQQDLGLGYTIEGPLLLSDQHIVSPQGRAPPQLFARADGKAAGVLAGGGGSFALLTEQNEVLHGPGNKRGWLSGSRLDSQEQFATFESGISMVVHHQMAYLLDSKGVTAIDRSAQRPVWKIALRAGEELILAGSTLFVGGDGYVAAVSAESGELQWASPIVGRGRGLAVAQEHLVVSTDRGQVTAFASGSTGVSADSAAVSSADSSADSAADSSHAALASHSFANAESWIELTSYQPLPIAFEEPATVAAPPTSAWPKDLQLIEHWTFQDNSLAAGDAADASAQPNTIASHLPTGHSIELPANSRFIKLGDQHALVLEETIDAQAAKDFREVDYPKKSLTAIATVRIDKEQPWGGLMSMSQDNGSYERGWMLGFQNRRFGFGVKAEQGEPGLSWALSDKLFQTGQWYQVVGTYDGTQTSLYVNGELVAQHDKQSGSIDYPDEAAFQLASYRDKDEHYYGHGKLHGLALAKRAIGAAEVQQLYQLTCQDLGDDFRLEGPPQEQPKHAAPVQGEDQFALDALHMEFVQPRTAQIQWTTEQPTTCRLVILSGSAQAEIALQSATETTTENTSENTTESATASDGDQQPRQRHRWLIHDVDQREVVRFCIKQQAGSEWLKSAEYQCDGHFDYTRPQLPQPQLDAHYSRAAAMVKTIPWTNLRGIAVVVQDDAEPYTAEALCHESGLDVVVLLKDEEQVHQLRNTLLQRKMYGRPISVHSLTDLPRIPNNCLNVIWLVADSKQSLSRLSDAAATDAFTALQRCLTPGGLFINAGSQVGSKASMKGYSDVSPAAAADLQLAVHRKPRLVGSAGWTHMYGTGDNTAFAGETLAGASYAEQLEVTWAGRPGPRYQSDRGNRKPSPLAANGRLYLQGHYRLLGLDAHNGTILWAKEMPKMVRFNIPRDCSNWCCDSQAIYVAVEDKCLRLDGATGEQLAEFTAPSTERGKMNWGFVSRQDDLLIGSSVAPSSSFTEYWGNEFWYDAKDGENAKKVASDVLFAVDSQTGVERWRYDSALVINPTIAISDGRIVFAECRSKQLRDAPSRRLDGDELWNNLFIVAIDKHTGQRLWESPAKPLPGVSAMYGVSTTDQYLLETSSGGEFAIYSLALDSGKMQWRGKYGWEADHHGKHLSRPAIVGDKIYLRPLTLDRISGKVLSKTFPVGHQCGTYTCTSNAIFLRAGNLAMWDGNSVGATRWERLRPDCWISTIPAEGMLLSPEGGGGCSCGGWIETSVGFGTRM